MSEIRWSLVPVSQNGVIQFHVIRKSGRKRELNWLTKGTSKSQKNKPTFGAVRDFDNEEGQSGEQLWIISNPTRGDGQLNTERFYPHLLKPTQFSKMLMEFKQNSSLPHLSKLLNLTTKSAGFYFHEEGVHDEYGIETGDSVVNLDSYEKTDIKRLRQSAEYSSIKIESPDVLSTLAVKWNADANANKKENTENVPPNLKQSSDTDDSAAPLKRSNDGSIRKGANSKKVVMEQKISQHLKSESGLEQNLQKYDTYFKDVPLNKIFPHPDLLKDKTVNPHRVKMIENSMKATFDPTLSVLTLIPRLESDERMTSNPASYWLVTGFNRYEALMRTQKGEDSIHCFVVNARGPIQAAYLHSRNNYLSSNIASKPVNIQDYLKLFNSIRSSVSNLTTTLKIVHSIMVVERQDADTITNIKKICREFSQSDFDLLIKAINLYEEFDSKDSEHPNHHVKQYMNKGLAMPITKEMMKQISICPQEHATKLLLDIIEKRQSFREVGNSIKNLIKLRDVEAQVVDLVDEAKDIEQVRELFPDSFSPKELLDKFSHSKITKDGAKTEQRHRLELKVNSVVNKEINQDAIEYVNCDENIEEAIKEAVSTNDVIVLSMKTFSLDLVKECLTSAANVQKVSVAIIIKLDSSVDELKVIQSFLKIPSHAAFDLVKTSSLKTGSAKKSIYTIENLDSAFLIGRFNIKEPIPAFNRVPITEVISVLVEEVITPGGRVSSFGVDMAPAKVHEKNSDFVTSYVASTQMMTKFKATHETVILKQLCLKENQKSGSNVLNQSAEGEKNTPCEEEVVKSRNTGECSSIAQASKVSKNWNKPEKIQISDSMQAPILDNLEKSLVKTCNPLATVGLTKQLSTPSKEVNLSVVHIGPTESIGHESYEQSTDFQVTPRKGLSFPITSIDNSASPKQDRCDSSVMPQLTSMTNIDKDNNSNISSELKIEDVSKETLFNLTGLMTKVIQTQNESVLRISDGTLPKIFACQLKSEATEDVCGFIDIFVENKELKNIVENKDVVPGSFIKLFNVQCQKYQKYDSQQNSMDFVDSSDQKSEAFKFVIKDSQGSGPVLETLKEDDTIKIIEERLLNMKSQKQNSPQKQLTGDHASKFNNDGDSSFLLHEQQSHNETNGNSLSLSQDSGNLLSGQKDRQLAKYDFNDNPSIIRREK